MTALPLTITRGGLDRFTSAQTGGSSNLLIASVGVTAAAFVVSPTLTALPGEFRRVDSISGQAIDNTTVHITVRDEEAIAYGVRGFGLFLADGTLFAVYGQADMLVQKSVSTTLFLAFDVAFPTTDVGLLRFGDTNFLLPPASTTAKGLVELASEAEADAGTPGPLAITAALLARAVAGVTASVAQAIAGLTSRTIYGSGLIKGGGDLTANRTLTVDAAGGADTRAGTRGDLAVTPAGLASAGAVFVVQQNLAADGGYRVWSDGLKECWGSVGVPAKGGAIVALPVPHTSFVVPASSPTAIDQDEQMLGLRNIALTGFEVRNNNPFAATLYWQTKGR